MERGREAAADSSVERTKEFSYTTVCHGVFTFMIPLLMELLQMHCQAVNDSPFRSNPLKIWAFIFGTTVYCFASTDNLHQANHPQLFAQIALVSGSFSILLLVTFFLPRFVGILFLVSWTLIPIMAARGSVKYAFMWLAANIRTQLINYRGQSPPFPQDGTQAVGMV